jgi:hypothetical protein
VVTKYLETLGEFSGPDDRRWLLTDFPSTVDALARTSSQVARGDDFDLVRSKYWLPVRVDDGRTSALVAEALSHYLQDRGHLIPASGLIGHVFSGTIPPAFAAISRQLPLAERVALEAVFKTYSSDRCFLNRFTSSLGYRALGLLGLEWEHPRLSDLGFNGPTVAIVTEKLATWSTMWRTVQKGLGVPLRRVVFRCSGDPWQLCNVRERPGGAEISSYYTFQKVGANFRACFGTPVIYKSAPMRVHATGLLDIAALRVSLTRESFGLNV